MNRPGEQVHWRKASCSSRQLFSAKKAKEKQPNLTPSAQHQTTDIQSQQVAREHTGVFTG